MHTRILGVVGSLRDKSVSRCGVQYWLDAAKQLGAETDIVDLRTIRLPMYDPDGDDTAEYKQILERVNWAQAFVLGSPDYHGGMSGSTKNFLDHFWREFAGKLFGYICASHEKGLTVMDQMRTAVRQCYGWSLPYGVSLSDDDLDDTKSTVTNKRVTQRIELAAHDLVNYGALIRRQFETDVAGRDPKAGFAARFQS